MTEKPGSGKRDRGAAMVEMAIVLPLFVLLVFGLIEFGLLFRERLTIASATSSAARTGATMGARAEADIRILEALEAGLYDQVNTDVLIRVDIFRANPTTGAKTSDVNRYAYIGGGGCKWSPCPDPALFSPPTYGSPSDWGDPALRDTSLDPGGGGLDVLGVEVVYHHDTVTDIVPFLDRDLTERALVRLEPDVFGTTTTSGP